MALDACHGEQKGQRAGTAGESRRLRVEKSQPLRAHVFVGGQHR